MLAVDAGLSCYRAVEPTLVTVKKGSIPASQGRAATAGQKQ